MKLKKILINSLGVVVRICLLAGLVSFTSIASAKVAPENQYESLVLDNKEKVKNKRYQQAYAIGQDQAQGVIKQFERLQSMGIELDIKIALRAFRYTMNNTLTEEGMSGNSLEQKTLEQEELKQIIYGLDREIAVIEQRLARNESLSNLVKNRMFLNKNRKLKGVAETKSGLQFNIIKRGRGDKPKHEQLVTIEFEGRLMDGSVFDSSKSNKSFSKPVKVSKLIAGLSESIQRMKVGSEWEVYIPSNLGYGESRHGKIPANALLIFKIKLISIHG